MAVSRFNYTGMLGIDRKDVAVTIEDVFEGPSSFSVELLLDKYKFPKDAIVLIEAYYRTTRMRFDYGMVGAIKRPVDTRLSEFESAQDVLFRVRITENKTHAGRMLGAVDKIRPNTDITDDEERLPLLSVRPSDEIGDEVFYVDMDPKPTLLINKGVGDWRSVVTSSIFQALTAPAILRSILVHIIVFRETLEFEDPESPHARWLKFAKELPGAPRIEDAHQDPMGWIDDVVQIFAKEKSSLSLFLSQGNKERR